MKYIEWNNSVASYLFNSGKAGKEVYLYITKLDIINIGKSKGVEGSEDEIWNIYVSQIKTGLPSSITGTDLIDKTKHAFNQWVRPNLLSIDNVEITHPLYINYLVFLVMPLIEVQGNYNANNYYDRLGDFLRENGITQNLRNRLAEIDHVWRDLNVWANSTKNGELGFFRLRNFIHPNWIYVGKMFSQCIFPPRAINRLPELFLQAGMIPDSIYSQTEIKRYLLQFSSSLLFLPTGVVDMIRNSETSELGQSIIDLVFKEYQKWTGESHVVDEGNGVTKIRRNDILSRIYLQFQIFQNEGRIAFSYRMKSANAYPEDLTFHEIEVREEKAGYSKTLNLPFLETFQLKDDFNKWIAKFQAKEVRLFLNGGMLQLSTDYWLETDSISKSDWMYLLCTSNCRDKIISWGQNHCAQFEDETDYENMPTDYFLFKFCGPSIGIPGIPVLTITEDKTLQLIGGLTLDFRTFTSDFLPEVEITNSDGHEQVYMQYKHSEEKIVLNKSNSYNNRWLLPGDISLYSDFNIRVENEIFSGNETTYKIVPTDDSASSIKHEDLPKRDSFGRISQESLSHYSIGSNVVGANLTKQQPYKPLFQGIIEDELPLIVNPAYENTKGNILLSFLTAKKCLASQEFYTAFELLHAKYYGDRSQAEDFNYSKIKKASLNFFDYLGYLDYEYETKSIIVNPPQLVFIPCDKGRKVLLIGGRDNGLVEKIIKAAPNHQLQVEITRQFESNGDLLLPDAITIKAFGSKRQNYGESNIASFAKELGIEFKPEELVQISMTHFCADIETYEQDLIEKRETSLTYEDWARYIFNSESFRLDKSTSEVFDKTCALFEYRLRPWEFHHRLWLNNKCFEIDKNWGKYLVLKHKAKNIILFDKENKKVAVPLELPLPRLLAESIMLLSGLAPVYTEINGKAYRVYENIPSIFIKNLFDKLKQKTVEHNI